MASKKADPVIPQTIITTASFPPDHGQSRIAIGSANDEAVSLKLAQESFEPEGDLDLGLEAAVTTRYYKGTAIHLVYNDDITAFDQILAWKLQNPQATFADACQNFCAREGVFVHADAIIKILYAHVNTHWDVVLKYDPPAKHHKHGSPSASVSSLHLALNGAAKPSERDQSLQKARAKFEFELLLNNLFLVREKDMDVEDGPTYVKILIPFAKLCQEAEKLQLKLTVTQRFERIRERVLQRSERVREEHAKQMKMKGLTATPATPRRNEKPDANVATVSVPIEGGGVAILKVEEKSNDTIANVPTGGNGSDAGAASSGDKIVSARIRDGPPPVTKKTFDQENEEYYSESPSRQLRSLIRYMFAIVTLPIQVDAEPFHRDRVADFRGGMDPEGQLQIRFFSNSHRNLLTGAVIRRIKIRGFGGSKLNQGIENLIADGVYTDVFAIHDGPAHHQGASSETNPRHVMFTEINNSHILVSLPLRQIRNYFGEKIAFYFAWLNFYALWTVFAAIVGIVITISGIIYGSLVPIKFNSLDEANNEISIRFFLIFDNFLTLPFAIFMGVWSALFLEFWKRQNAILKVMWKVTDMKVVENRRAQWHGTALRKSPVTKKTEVYFPKPVQDRRRTVAWTVIFFSAVFMGVVQFAIVIWRAFARTHVSTTISVVSSALISLVIIFVLTPLYDSISTKLNEWLNWKSNIDYDNSLTVKKFLGSFIVTYSSLIYIGMFKNVIGQELIFGLSDSCGFSSKSSCLSELMINLIIIFLGLQFVAQIQQVVIPKLLKSYKLWRKKVSKRSNSTDFTNHTRPQFMHDDILTPYSQEDDYSAKVLQFGFISLFSCAFPLAPFFAALNNIVEIRIDSYRLLVEHRRPFSLRAQNIGLWEDILTAVSYVGVFTNGVIIAFSSDYFDEYIANAISPTNPTAVKLAFVLLFEHIVLILKYIIVIAIPDVPERAREAMERELYLDRVDNEEVIEDEDETDIAEDLVISRKRWFSWFS
ncbi:calcium-activated chloride channel-domain-containing protein [Polychytrium aggregatum]|uniref:calcium-activated chloride channel-domain-containing protein n=1 Tax=Polychytrium aggregatum TaxID=110093 RepID=UPI0022FDEE50|nr:calcium-activated chloride channel-domain-containing protein [Polychytrium aggregatum]KAI9207422.1 calcium-activated chloride channel-domain-containing protein [Polychytrium aggregatum]